MMKKHLWMSGAIVLALAGCQSAQKKEESLARTEDEAFDREVLETFNTNQPNSTWMAFYGDELKTGKIKLSELRRAERTIASDPILYSVRLIDEATTLLKDSGTFAKALKQADGLLKGNQLKAWKSIKSADEMKAFIKQNPEFDQAFAKRLADNVLVRHQLATPAMTSSFKKIAENAENARLAKSKSQLLDFSGVAKPNKADPTLARVEENEIYLRKKYASELSYVNGKFEHPKVVKQLNQMIDDQIAKVPTNFKPAEQAEAIATLQKMRDTGLQFHEKTGWYLWLVDDTCKVISDLPSLKSFAKSWEMQLENAQALRVAKKKVCPASLSKGIFNYQKIYLQVGDDIQALNRGFSMGEHCPLAHTDISRPLGEMAKNRTPASQRFICK